MIGHAQRLRGLISMLVRRVDDNAIVCVAQHCATSGTRTSRPVGQGAIARARVDGVDVVVRNQGFSRHETA
jgi:hypothetical protein